MRKLARGEGGGQRVHERLIYLGNEAKNNFTNVFTELLLQSDLLSASHSFLLRVSDCCRVLGCNFLCAFSERLQDLCSSQRADKTYILKVS